MQKGSLIRVFIIITGCIVFYQCSIAQKSVKELYTREVFLNYPDSLLKINILINATRPKISPDRIYYWYGSDILASNRGGFSGSLLHGKYSQYDKGKRLRSQGSFKSGLKDGEWKLWNENGEIISRITWKEGVKNGTAYYFDQNGKLQREVNFQKGVMHGVVIVYKGSEHEKIRYKNGFIIKKPVKAKRKESISKQDSKPKADKNNSSPVDSTGNHQVFKKLFKRKGNQLQPTDQKKSDKTPKSRKISTLDKTSDPALKPKEKRNETRPN